MTIDPRDLPSAKRTLPGLYVTAKEAWQAWQAATDEVVLIDVRTPEEWMFVGHAPMAWKVPLATQSYQWDEVRQTYPMRPLPDFVARVRTFAEPQTRLMLMCRSGGRSAMAVDQLARAGYESVYQIVDGMEGDTVDDPQSVFRGQRLRNGWKNSGCPWTYMLTPDRVVLPARPA